MQNQTGTVSFEQGSFKFVGDLNTDWTDVRVGEAVIGLKNSDYDYQVATKSPPDTNTRSVTNGVTTTGSPVVTSATAAFTSGDLRRPISGSGIPPNSYIGVINSPTSIGLSSSPVADTPVNATLTATGVTIVITGFWECTVTALIADPSATGALYGIQQDYTENLNLPLLVDGDYQIPQHLTRAFRILDLFGLNRPTMASMEEGSVNLTAGQTTVTVIFAIEKASASFMPMVSLVNTSGDTNKDAISWIPTARSTAGMTIKLVNPPPTNNYVLHWRVGGPSALPGTQQVIADVTLAVDTASHTISSIPQSYTHLKLVVEVRSSSASADWLLVRFNNDANDANYQQQTLYVNGAETPTEYNTALLGAAIGAANGTDTTAPENFCAIESIIPFYSETSHWKRVKSSSGESFSGTGAYRDIHSAWLNTAAIASIILLCSAGNMKAGTRCILYGIL